MAELSRGHNRRASSSSPPAPGPPVSVVTSAFGGAQRPGHQGRERSGEAQREELWIPVHQVRVPTLPLTRLSAQPGTKARVTVSTQKAPWAEPCWGHGPHSGRAALLAITPGLHAEGRPCRPPPEGSLTPARPPALRRGSRLQVASGPGEAARPGPWCPHLPLGRMSAPLAPWVEVVCIWVPHSPLLGL